MKLFIALLLGGMLVQAEPCLQGTVTQGSLSYRCMVLQPGGTLPFFLPPGTSQLEVTIDTTNKQAVGFLVSVTHDGKTEVLAVVKNAYGSETLALFYMTIQYANITAVNVAELVLSNQTVRAQGRE